MLPSSERKAVLREQNNFEVHRVNGTTDATVDAVDQRSIDAAGVFRYSVIFAAIVAPASLVFLGVPAGLLATWAVARLIARKYRRQITVRETFHLALASWALIAIVRIAVQIAVNGPAIGLQLPFWLLELPFRLLELVLVWTAYLWLGRFVIGRNIIVRPDDAGNRSASLMLSQQKERYADAMARSITLGAGWLTVAMFGMFFVIILAAIVSIALALFGLGDISQAAFLITVPVGMLALMGGWVYYIQRKAAEVFPSHRLVLWLRRFHQADLMEFPFPAFLERLCRGIAVPITLQDSSVLGAKTAAQLRPAYHALRSLLAVGWFGLVYSGIAASRGETWRDPQVAIAVVGILVSLAVMAASAVAIKRLGVVRLGTSHGRQRAERLMTAIDSNAGVPQTLTVVSTPDKDWQAWVLLFIERADAVVIDVTHLSENLHWELRTLAEHLVPEQLVLAYGQREGENQGIPSAIESELESILGRRMIEHSHRFFYTIPRPRWWHGIGSARKEQKGWLQPPKAMAKIYSQRLAEALIDAFSASDRVREREAGVPLTAEVSAERA